METFPSVLTRKSTLNYTTFTLEAANTHKHALIQLWYSSGSDIGGFGIWLRDTERWYPCLYQQDDAKPQS